MSNLEEALKLFKEQLGDFDNIKLRLGSSDGMTREAVDSELLVIAQQLRDGVIVASVGPSEASLTDLVIQL